MPRNRMQNKILEIINSMYIDCKKQIENNISYSNENLNGMRLDSEFKIEVQVRITNYDKENIAEGYTMHKLYLKDLLNLYTDD